MKRTFLIGLFIIIGCGKETPNPAAAAFAPAENDTDSIAAVDVATTRTCERTVAGSLYRYIVVRHTITPEVSVECHQGANSFSATYPQGHQRFTEAVCQIVLNPGTNEYWVFATPNAGSGQPTQANYANNGFAGAQINFADSDCEVE